MTLLRSLLALASLAACCYATTAGTRFQLVFMENGVNFFFEAPLEVHVSNTGNSPATVTISSATNLCPAETRTVSAGSSARFDVCYEMRLQPIDFWPSHKTVLVESNVDVMVYAYNKERFSADGYYAIPTTELAYSYVLSTFGNANIATQFAVSATTADTTVRVTLPSLESLPVQVNHKGSVYTNGQSFDMLMSQYETFLGQARADLTGTRVQANNPIAVFSSNVRNKDTTSSRDHLASQLHPTGDWGVRFALAPVPRTNNYGDFVRIVANKPLTPYTVTCDGKPTATGTLLIAEDFSEFEMTSSCVISADDAARPLQIVQMVKSQDMPKSSDVADPTMFLLVGQAQWLNDYISPSLAYQKTNAAYEKNFAFLAIADGEEGGLRIDGNSITSANWTRINGVASAWVEVSPGSHRFTHSSNQDFGVMVYGASDRESYGFALGADLSNSGCQESLSIRGDGTDNDCDGNNDEELCDGVDDDGDGLIDEDCRVTREEAVGNLYVIMFTMNDVTDNSNAQEFIEVYVSAANISNDVTYSLTTSLGKNRINEVIPAGDVDIFLDRTKDLLHLGSGISNKAIRIEASEDIVVYGVNKLTFSTDAFLAFPVDVVGSEYYSAHYYPGDDLNEFAFTPVKDDGPTTIIVTMPNNTDENGVVRSSANFGSQRLGPLESTSVVLEYGQTAQFQAASNDDNINGAYIKSDKPISVFSGNVRAKVDPQNLRSRDHLVQQLSPVSTWGKEFVTVPIPRTLERGDIFFITASVANTNLEIVIKDQQGGSSTQTLVIDKAGSYARQDIGSKQYAHITADQPVQVFQYVKTTDNKDLDAADPAMMMIPPVVQWSRNYQFITPQTGQDDGAGGFKPFENFVMIAIHRDMRNGLRLDGSELPTHTWVELVGSNYSATEILVPIDVTNRHSLTHTNQDVMFQALMYGRANRESYALPLGMRLTDSACSRTTQAAGDGIDNDCDNEIDEEVCDQLDNDLDGLIDEDCSDGSVSGHTFYVTFMEHTVDYPQNTNLELYAAVVGDNEANIRLQAPLVEFPKYDITAAIKPGEVYSFGFGSHLKNEKQGISGKTIFLRSGSGVVVYGVNKEKFSNDAFLVYPESSLGTDHYTCSWYPSTLPTEFAVAATQDNTVVTITLPSNRVDIWVSANEQNYTSGDNFSVTLQRFEVYQAQSAGDLTGSRVQTSIRAAVFSGNVRTNVELSGSRDHLVQQMIPTTSYGTDFSVVPFPGRTVGDVLKIVARQSNTIVRVNNIQVGTIQNAGEFLQYQLASTSRITLAADKPVMVVQFVKSQDGRNNPEEADPAMLLVPSNTNFIDVATFITPIYSGGRIPGLDYTNYVTLVIANGEQGNVRLNGGVLTDISWDPIASSGFVTSTFTVSSGSTHTITTTSAAKFYGRLYGRADRESYAFPIGFSF